jgi:signal transduction histidine kinase
MEFRKLGRHMRDGLCQELAGIGLLIETFQGRIPCHNSPCEREVVSIGMLMRQAIQSARRIIRTLEPLETDPSDLPVALRHLVEDTSAATNLACEFRGSDSVMILEAGAAIQLFRIAQICLEFAVSASVAGAVRISLMQSRGHVELCVAAPARGANRAGDLAKSPSWAMIQHRARAMGAGVTLADRGGLCLICRAPNRKAGQHADRNGQGRNSPRGGRGKEKNLPRG